MSDIRWVVYLIKPGATITAPDKKTAQAIAEAHWGSSVARVQSVASVELGDDDEAAAARTRQRQDE